jgi:hypothetical protein
LSNGASFLRAEGRLVSCRIFVEHVCVLVAGPLAGYLAGLPFGTAAVIGAAIAVVIAPIAAADQQRIAAKGFRSWAETEGLLLGEK